jgi:hypothetical protein
MQDIGVVCAACRIQGNPFAADWIEHHPSDYMKGIVNGFGAMRGKKQRRRDE